jgi:predicted nucleic acid-binding protein
VKNRALRMGEEFFSGTLATVYYLTEADIRLTWEIFRSFSDKRRSFTDCASKIIIDKLNLKLRLRLRSPLPSIWNGRSHTLK